MASLVQNTASTPVSKHSTAVKDRDVRFEKKATEAKSSTILVENNKPHPLSIKETPKF